MTASAFSVAAFVLSLIATGISVGTLAWLCWALFGKGSER